MMTEESKQDTNLDSLLDNDESKIKMECNNNADDGDGVNKQPSSKTDSCKVSDKENEINIINEISLKDNVNTVLSNLDINIHDNHGSEEALEPSDEIAESNRETIIKDEDDNAVDNGDDFDMEQHAKTPKEEVESDPNFAIICSFFEKFGSYLELEYSIQNLKNMFENNNKDLIDLHIKLLRKRRKYINKEKWEKALKSFCAEYSSIDEWELENFGYQNAKLSLRLRILVRLLEAMFDNNQKFKSELNNSSEANSLRVPPFGRDITGYTYWYQIDSDLNFRLYKDEPDEECSWSLVSKNIEELNECIQDLEKISYEDFKCSFTPSSEESNSNQALNLHPKLEPIIENEEEAINNDGDQPIKSPIVKSENDEKIEKDMVQIKEEEDRDLKQEKQEIQSEFSEETKVIRTYQNELLSVVEELDATTVEEEISFIYESILDKLEKENDQVSPKEIGKKSSRGKKGKGRGRKGRKYGNRKSSSIKKADDSTETRKDQEIKDDLDETEPKKDDSVSVAESPADDKSEVTKTQVKNTGRKRRTEIEKLQENFAEGLTVKRASRRIQALQEKKLIEMQEEQKRLEKELQEKRRKKEAADAARAASILAASFACDRSNDSSDHRKSKRRKKKVSSDEDYQKDSDDDEELNEKKRKKSKKGKGRRKKGANPWEESGDSDDEKHENVYEDDYYDEMLDDENDELKFDDDEDEFACEEIDPNDEPVIIRRARTVKKSKDDLNDFDLETVVNDDKPCGKCGKYDNPHWILLCDKCDDGYHTSCLRPPLFLIPSGEWFCPPCEHKLLLEKLQSEYKRLCEELERQASEKKRQKKRWKYAHCDISSENILEGNGESNKNEDIINDVDAGVSQEKKIPSRKGKIKLIFKKPNGYLKDKDEDELNSDDERSSSITGDDESSEEQEDEDDDDEISAISSEDEIGRIAFSDVEGNRRRNRHHHRDKKRKEKRVDINDYSRSGLKLRSARRRKPINYRFKEFDDMIKSAILQEEGEEEENCLDDVDGSTESGLPRSKGKDIENILKANAEMPDFSINPFETCLQDQTIGNVHVESESKASMVVENKYEKIDSVQEKRVFSDDDVDDDDSVAKKPDDSKNRKKIKKKSLTNLDFSDDEAEEDHASDEDFKMADDDDEMDEELTEIEEDAAGDTETESDSDFRTFTKRRSTRVMSKRSSRSRSRKKRTKKTKRLKRKFLVDSDEEEDEDEDDDEEEEEDEISSEDDAGSYSDESSDYMPHPRRAALNKRYREDSSTDEEEEEYRKPKDKYQEDEDYREFDDDDDDDVVKAKHSKKKEPQPKLNPSVLNYSQECRAKKRKRVINDDDDDEDDDNSDEPMAEKNDAAKVDESSKSGGEKITGKKPDSKLAAISTDKSIEAGKNVDKDKSTSANDQRKDVEDDVGRNQETTKPMSSIKNEEYKAENQTNDQSTFGDKNTTANSNKAEAIKNDQSAYYSAPPQSSSVQFSKTVDPLNSIQQMNSKFDYVNPPSTTTTTVTAGQPAPADPSPRPSMPSAYPGAPPGPPPPPIHFQRHSYHPQNSVQAPPPYSNITTPYNPPPNTPGYPLPPSQPQQYLARPPPAGPPIHGPSYSGQQHPMAPAPSHYPQQSSPIRTHLSSHSPTQNVYNPGLYAQPPRYPVVSTAVAVPPSGEKCDGSYTLTNLDSYNKPANYPPPNYGQPPSYAGQPRPPPQLSRPNASSSPQILNLDSGTCNSYPPYSAARPPAKQPPPPPPHYYATPGYENMVRTPHPAPPPPPDYYGTHPPHPAPSGVASPGFYPSPGPPPGMHHAHVRRMSHPANPFPPQGNSAHPPPPPHYMPRNTSPRHHAPIPQPPSSYSTAMVTNNLPQPTTTASSSSTTAVRPALVPPPPTSTYGSPAGQNVAAYPPPFPQYPPVQGYPPPPPPPPYPPASNGGFMIQNILLNRPTVAKQPPVCAVKSAPKATKSAPKTKKTKDQPSNAAAAMVGGKTVETNPTLTTGSPSNNKSNQSKAKGGGGRNKKAKNQPDVAGGEAAQI